MSLIFPESETSLLDLETRPRDEQKGRKEGRNRVTQFFTSREAGCGDEETKKIATSPLNFSCNCLLDFTLLFTLNCLARKFSPTSINEQEAIIMHDAGQRRMKW
jgi:hypothetical protein